MRIAFVVGHFPKLSETFILNQVTGLIERGHQVDIYSEYPGDWNHVHPDVKRYDLQQHTYPLYRAPQNYGWRILQGMGLLLTRFPKAPKLLLRSLDIFRYGFCAGGGWLAYSAATLADCGCPAYDIVHAQFGTQGYQAWFLQQMLHPRPKLVVMFRGHDISSYLQTVGDGFYDKLFAAADTCLTNCEFFRQRVIQLGCPPEKVAVHYSGLDVEKFTYRPRRISPGETVRLITTGRLVEKKGIEYAIRAIAHIAPQYPQLQYTIVGDGPLRSTFEALIADLHLEDTVQLVGWQSEETLIHYLDQAHLFIAPSVTAANGNQDAPINVLKEAMALGLPVLSTNHGGIPELVQGGVSGYLVPERDAAALAERLGWLLAEPDRWPEMGQAGRAAVEKTFNLTALNDLLVARYQALLRSDPLPESDSLQSLPDLATPVR